MHVYSELIEERCMGYEHSTSSHHGLVFAVPYYLYSQYALCKIPILL